MSRYDTPVWKLDPYMSDLWTTRPERHPVNRAWLTWPSVRGPSIVGQVVPAPNDPHGRQMVVTAVEDGLATSWGSRVDHPDGLVVRARGHILSKGDESVYLKTMTSFFVLVADLTDADADALFKEYQGQVERATANLAAVEAARRG